MNQQQKEYIVSLERKGEIDSNDLNQIWQIYFEHFGTYPDGQKSCSGCVRRIFNQLVEIMRNEPTTENNV